MPLRSERVVVAVLAVLAGSAFALVIWNQRQLVSSQAWVDHTYEVISELNALRDSAAQVESDMRGYVATGDPRFLVSSAKEEEPAAHVAKLEALVADDPAHVARMDEIAQLVKARLAYAAEGIRARRDGGLAAGQAVLASGRGRELSAEIERHVAVTTAAERVLLATRIQRSTEAQNRVWTVVGLLALTTLLFWTVTARARWRAQAASVRSGTVANEAEHRFRLLIEHVLEYALILLDPEGRVVGWNDGAQRLTGYAAEEIIGQSFSTFFTEEERVEGQPEKELQRAVRDGRSAGEGWRARKDGSRFWVDSTLSAIRNERGELQGFAKVTRDVTERRRLRLIGEASALLLQSGDVETHLADVIELSVPFLADWGVIHLVEGDTLKLIGAAHADPSKRSLTLEVNRRFPEDRALGRTWHAVDSGELEVVAQVDDALLDQLATDPEHRALLGELGLRSLLIAPLVGRARVLGVLTLASAQQDRQFDAADVAFAADLARRCATALENAHAHATVDLEREFLQTTLQQLREGIVVVESPEGNVLLANDAAMRILRVRESKLESVIERTFLDATGKPLRRSQSPIHRALEEGEAVPEMELQIGDGHDRAIVEVGASPVKNKAGKTIAAVASFRDVTERKRVAARALEEAKFRELFIGILAHDLRNPLSAIMMASDLLLRRGLRPAEARVVAKIATSGDRMTAMISDLLDLTRARLAGGIPVAPKRVDLRQVCRVAIDELTLAHPNSVIELEAVGDVSADVDPERFTQALSNLVGNAVNHGAEGRSIAVRLGQKSADRLELEVHNEGEPIPEELLPVIFDPFRRGSTAGGVRLQKGLGLGLFIANEIVKGHGGSMAVTSDREHGTSFCVQIPKTHDRARGSSARPEAHAEWP